jgi:hypothetical protein
LPSSGMSNRSEAAARAEKEKGKYKGDADEWHEVKR